MKDSEIVIQVNHLHKKYGNFVAVKDLSFSVKKGEIFGLLGPNGAGKTTTLEIIETLREKTSGEVIVGGYSVDNDRVKIRSVIGIQLQQAGFYPELNLVETLNMFAGFYNVRINPLELLTKVELKDKARSRVEKLSGGQRQRFSIATTLVNRPAIVFLDEPSTGLDPQARRNLWGLIKEINASGTTVVITTHYMDEAEELCNRLAIIDQGNLVSLDTPAGLIEKLIKSGFKKERITQEANLEDVFINLTGKSLRE